MAYPPLTLTLQADVALPVCRGACVRVQASPSGGNAPYSVTFDGGEEAGEQARRFCPTADLSVEATVVGSATTGEFENLQQASASLTLPVRDCEDGGAPEQAALCIDNPSFEEMEMGPDRAQNFWSARWTACSPLCYTVTPDEYTGESVGAALPAENGLHHVTLMSGLQNDVTAAHGYIDQQLCAPMRAGARHDLAFAAYTVSGRALIPLPEDRARLQLWGSM
jgi:hypothetical protein